MGAAEKKPTGSDREPEDHAGEHREAQQPGLPNRAYLLKEQLRAAFEAKGTRGRALLAGWLAGWPGPDAAASRSSSPSPAPSSGSCR